MELTSSIEYFRFLSIPVKLDSKGLDEGYKPGDISRRFGIVVQFSKMVLGLFEPPICFGSPVQP